MTGLAITALAVTAVGAGISAYSAYKEGKAAAKLSKEQARQYAYQAQEDNRLAQLEVERAGVAQLQGEQEADHRSRALAAEIGHEYAEWAGNGLLVDQGDTFGNVLSSTVAEAQADISTINDNTAINVWNHLADARSYRASAANKLMSAQNSLLAGKNAKKSGRLNALGTAIGGVGQVASSAFTMFG